MAPRPGQLGEGGDAPAPLPWLRLLGRAPQRPPSLGRGTSYRAPAPLCTHWQDTGHFSRGTSRVSRWEPCARTGTAATGCGSAMALKASPTPGDCRAVRASREAQPCRAPSPRLGPSQGEKRTLPGQQAEPGEGPPRAPPARTLPHSVADGDKAMLRLTLPSTASTAKGSPRLSICMSSSETRRGRREGAVEPFTPYSQTHCGPSHPGHPKATLSTMRLHSLVTGGRR